MAGLEEAYKFIDGAEKQSRKGNLAEALTEYRNALENLSLPSSSMGDGMLSPEVNDAIELLRQDINDRIREMEVLVDFQRPKASNNAPVSGSVLLNMNSSIQGMSKTRSWDSRNGNSSIGIQSDPLLASMLNKLQSGLTASLSEKINEKDIKKGPKIETIVNQHVMQFRKDLILYEQKKYKDFNVKLDLANKENKKLSNQILKLRERWDSLVESAKQRRIRQQDE